MRHVRERKTTRSLENASVLELLDDTKSSTSANNRSFVCASLIRLDVTVMAREVSTTIAYHQFLMDESHIDSGRANAGGLQEELPWNRTGSGNDTFEEPYEGPEWLIVPLVFGLIFVVGVVGNGTLIFTVLVNKNMRTTPNVLLVSCMVNLDHRWIRSHVVIPLRVKHSLLFTKANCLANGDRFSLEIQYRMHSICQVYNRRFSRILSFYESQRLVGQPGCG